MSAPSTDPTAGGTLSTTTGRRGPLAPCPADPARSGIPDRAGSAGQGASGPRRPVVVLRVPPAVGSVLGADIKAGYREAPRVGARSGQQAGSCAPAGAGRLYGTFA